MIGIDALVAGAVAPELLPLPEGENRLAIFAPDFANGSAFSRVRFHTVISHPPFASRSAIA